MTDDCYDVGRRRASCCVRDYIAPEVLASAPEPKNTCHQLDSRTIRLGDGTACSEGRLNINKILPRLPFVKMEKTRQLEGTLSITSTLFNVMN